MSIEKFSGVLNNHAKDGFTIVLTKVIHILKNVDAIGLYTYLCSLPSTWIINVNHLKNALDIGEDKLYRLLKTLMDKGLLERKEIRESGRFCRYEYNVYMSPHRDSPLPEKPDAGNQGTYKVNSRIENKEYINKEKINKKESYPQIQSYSQREESSRRSSPPKSISHAIHEKHGSSMVRHGASQHDIDSFECFWELYPIKKDKLRVREMWFSQGCSSNAHEILFKLSEQLEKDSQFKDGYIPNPCNYITGERWNDSIVERRSTGQLPSGGCIKKKTGWFEKAKEELKQMGYENWSIEYA